MKRYSLYSLLIFAMLVTILAVGCKKSDINGKFYNPEGSVTASVSTLYSGLFYTNNSNGSYVVPRYWNLYTLLIPVFGEYSQISGYTTVNKVYEQPVNYTLNKWDNYYTTVMAQYRELGKYYNGLSSNEDKAGYAVFLETAKIFFYDQTAQMIDLWGDIPYSAAGSLNSAGTISLAKYDSAQTVYYAMINDLDRINTYLDSVKLGTFYAQQLTSYDYVNGGSLIKWRQYANSLRLRLAMRISYYDEAFAKLVVLGMLGNTSAYPMATTAGIQINLKGNLISTGNDIRNGFGVNPYASSFMIDSTMVPSADPRLPVYFTTNASGGYKGIANTTRAATIEAGQQANAYSRFDSTTFTENNNFPGVLISAAETNFSIAEAYERWGSHASAVSAYNNGIAQSIAFYYSIYNSSSYTGSALTTPTATTVAAFEAGSNVALVAGSTEGNLKKISTQKWLDFNILQANQAWIEYRRTGYPVLYFPTDGSSAASAPPRRLLYPGTEKSLNAVNYSAVQSKDNVTTKIFWDVK